jgi:PAS domain S-box-containing protein
MAQSDSCPLAQFRRFRALLDAIPQPAILKDTEGRIALANAAASRLWNKKPEELVGLTSGDLVDPLRRAGRKLWTRWRCIRARLNCCDVG